MKCLKIQEAILNPNHPDLADIYLNLAELCADNEDCHKSEKFYMKCLKIQERNYTSKKP